MTTNNTTNSGRESEFDVLAKAHDDCPLCDALIPTATTFPSGSTVTDDRTRVGGTLHSVTVERVRCRRAGTDCLCPVCIDAARDAREIALDAARDAAYAAGDIVAVRDAEDAWRLSTWATARNA